jgi:hypothetical protein
MLRLRDAASFLSLGVCDGTTFAIQKTRTEFQKTGYTSNTSNT